MEAYKNKQTGWGILFTLVAVLAVAFFILMRFGGIGPGQLLAFAVPLILICMFFSGMTVIIDGEYLRVSFFLNLVNIKFRLDEITSCKVVKNSWYQSWGIHYGRGRWVYNVSGYDAVEITMKDGKVHVIGTDDTQNLEKAIRKTTTEWMYRPG